MRPMANVARPAATYAARSTRYGPSRSISRANINAPAMPPRLSSAVDTMALSSGTPACRSRAGSQLTRKYSTSRFMKNTAHSSRVCAVRRPPNSCMTLMPCCGCASLLLKCTCAARSAPRIGTSSARSVASGVRRAASSRIDSGSHTKSAGSSSKGSAPPSQKVDSHPSEGIIRAARKPPSTAPSGKPQNIRLISVARERAGAYSAVSAMMLGIAPPRPRPVSSRRTSSVVSESAKGVSRVNRPKIAVVAMITRRRPKRSAAGPKTSAPSIRPARPAPNTGPKDETGRPHWAASTGATKATTWVSKPSSIAINAQSRTIRFWARPKGAWSIAVAASTKGVAGILFSVYGAGWAVISPGAAPCPRPCGRCGRWAPPRSGCGPWHAPACPG